MDNRFTARNRARGASAIEYLVALIFVGIASIAGYKAFGRSLLCKLAMATHALGTGQVSAACDSDSGGGAGGGPAVAANEGGGDGTAGPTGGSVCVGGVCTEAGRCFVAGTPILTDEGPRPIEAIEPGMRVLARDDGGGELVYRPVVRTFARTTEALVRLTLRDAHGRADTVELTPEHLLFVEGRGWAPAGTLAPGRDHLVDPDGAPLEVLVAAPFGAAEVPVYNFEVAESHTYYVGRLGLWAHNVCPPAGGPSTTTNPPAALTGNGATSQGTAPPPPAAGAAQPSPEDDEPNHPIAMNVADHVSNTTDTASGVADALSQSGKYFGNMGSGAQAVGGAATVASSVFDKGAAGLKTSDAVEGAIDFAAGVTGSYSAGKEYNDPDPEPGEVEMPSQPSAAATGMSTIGNALGTYNHGKGVKENWGQSTFGVISEGFMTVGSALGAAQNGMATFLPAPNSIQQGLQQASGAFTIAGALLNPKTYPGKAIDNWVKKKTGGDDPLFGPGRPFGPKIILPLSHPQPQIPLAPLPAAASSSSASPPPPPPKASTPRPTQQPATQQPATQQPATQQPATQQPATPQPATQQPATQQPATQQPATQQPATQQPATPQPATQQPATQQPATQQPATQQPAPSKPGSSTKEPSTPGPSVKSPRPKLPAPGASGSKSPKHSPHSSHGPHSPKHHSPPPSQS